MQKADEAAEIAYMRAVEAHKHAVELKANAGLVQASVEEPKNSSSSAEGTSEDEEEERKKKAAPLLPALPFGRPRVKDAVKDACARISKLLQESVDNKDKPEEVLVAWGETRHLVLSCGLQANDVQAVLALLPTKMRVPLCTQTNDDDLERWRGRLSSK